MATYRDLIEAAIDRETDILGQGYAVKTARTVDGIEVADDGSVESLSGDGKDVLEALVEAYKEECGQAAVTLIAKRLAKEGADDLDLPEILAGRM